MQFDKSMIIDLLRQQGEHGHADQAERELPDKVGHESDSGMLEKFGLNPQDLIAKLGGGVLGKLGGGGGGGGGGGLGKLLG